MDEQKKQSDTDTLVEDLGESLGYVQAFVSQEVEAVKLEVAEKISIASSAVITGLFLTIFASLAAIFASLALGFYLSSVFESNALGFSLVAGIYLLLLIVTYIFRKRLITDQVVEAVIQLIFDQTEDENNSQLG